MNQLIVNADDFGIHAEVNKAIIKGHQKGIITSTTLLANGDAYEEALSLGIQNPNLGIGIHLALVGGLQPIADPAKISSIVDKDGRFFSDHVIFISKVLKGEIDFQHVYTELDLQIKKIMDSPLQITHVDGHQHLHVLPQILKVLLPLCKKYDIKKMRIPQEKLFYLNGNFDGKRFLGKAGLSHYANRAKKYMNRMYINYPRYFWGMMNGGNMTEEKLLSILKEVQIKIGTHEIMVHPGANNQKLNEAFGWQYHWEEELAACLSPKVIQDVHRYSIRLVNYKDV